MADEEVVIPENDFLKTYMQMVEDTESPRVYHVWSALSGVAACCGRRIGLPFGIDLLYPNLYILLVGTAAARKSTALNITSRILQKYTGVRFAPADTGGKRQGLVAAMAGDDDEDDDYEDMRRQLNGAESLTLDNISKMEINFDRAGPSEPDQTVYVAASEFNNFIGHGNMEFLDFLLKMYDGEAYKYQLKDKKNKVFLDNPLVNLIGCTTPTNIAEALPAAAIGQGFTSRVIFVHGGKKYRSIPRPSPFNPELLEAVGKRYAEIYYGLKGTFTESGVGRAYLDEQYEREPAITDGRFTYYLSRRHTHLTKLAMVFAASRGSSQIEFDDAQMANLLLTATEKTMPEALGEYGMSAISAAKQKVLEYIMAAREPITMDILWTFMQRDIRHQDLANILNDLVSASKIQQVRRSIDNKISFIPHMTVTADTLDLMQLLQSSPTTEKLQ